MNYSNIIQLPFISIEQITFSKQNKGTKRFSLPILEQMELDWKSNATQLQWI